MKKPMADIAAAALDQGPRTPGGELPDTHLPDLGEGPVAVDVWIDGDLGFVLLLHRRDDGFVASEVYYSLKGEDHRWTDAEHLSGEIVGFERETPSAAENILSDASVVVLSESESRVFTGHRDDEDGDELVRLYELLVSKAVCSLRIEKSGPGTESESAVFHKDLTSRLAVVAVRPGERLRVVPLERSDSKTPTMRAGLDLFSSST
ncbi:hypothetical protein ACWEKM_08200 [Streptomyces sp. NPDC004752]